MKIILTEKPVARIEKHVKEFEAARKTLSSAAGQHVLSDMISASKTMLQDLESKAYADPYRATIFTAQARLRDVSAPSHQRAVYQEMIDVLSRGGQ